MNENNKNRVKSQEKAEVEHTKNATIFFVCHFAVGTFFLRGSLFPLHPLIRNCCDHHHHHHLFLLLSFFLLLLLLLPPPPPPWSSSFPALKAKDKRVLSRRASTEYCVINVSFPRAPCLWLSSAAAAAISPSPSSFSFASASFLF